MGLIHTVAILARDNRFRTPNLELKCLGTSFGGTKQKFSIPRDSTWPISSKPAFVFPFVRLLIERFCFIFLFLYIFLVTFYRKFE